MRVLRQVAPALPLLPLLALTTASSWGVDAPNPLLDVRAGGATTVEIANRDSFLKPAGGITAVHRRAFMVGQSLFNQNWVAAPSANRAHQGLGPLFNAQSCSACHARGGRGAPPDPAQPGLDGLLIRLSVPGPGLSGGGGPEPSYGGQFHPYAIFGIPGDGQLAISWAPIAGRYGDGSPYVLDAPCYQLEHLAYGPLDAGTVLGPRVAPILVGMGLLEAIPEADIAARALANCQDADGVRGELSEVWDVRAKALRLGRFGWTAGQPSVEQQIAAAFQGDIGITSTLYPRENTMPSQVAALGRPSGCDPGSTELTALQLERITLWARLLAVPARRQLADAQVRQGAAVFLRCRCDACHVASWRTGADALLPELSGQLIHPFTDLLLHDLGPGLADRRAQDQAHAPRPHPIGHGEPMAHASSVGHRTGRHGQWPPALPARWPRRGPGAGGALA